MNTHKHCSVCVSLFPEGLPFALLWWVKQPPHLVIYFMVMTACELDIYNLQIWTFISQKNTLGKTLFNTCLVSLVILLQFFFPYASLISLSRWKWYIICKKTKNKQTRNWFTTEMFYLVSIKKTDYKLGNFECIISGVYTSKGSGYCGCLTHTARNL